jgi:hypothetical protein
VRPAHLTGIASYRAARTQRAPTIVADDRGGMMRTLRLLLMVCAFLAVAGGAFAQTVTPSGSQLIPCRAGLGPFNSCGGLCVEGSTCVWVQSGATAACSCQVNALVCGLGTKGEDGYCSGAANTPDGDCQLYQGANAAATNYRCR